MMHSTITSWWFCLNVAWRVEWLYRRVRNMPPCFLSRQVALWGFSLQTCLKNGVGSVLDSSFYKSKHFRVSQHCRVRLLMKSFFHCCGSKVSNLRNYVEVEKRSGIDPDLFRDPNKIVGNGNGHRFHLQETRKLHSKVKKRRPMYPCVPKHFNKRRRCWEMQQFLYVWTHIDLQKSDPRFSFCSFQWGQMRSQGTVRESWRSVFFRISSALQTSWNTPVHNAQTSSFNMRFWWQRDQKGSI